MNRTKEFRKGIYHGMPIGLGYLSVSFGFGIMAVKSGLTTLVAALISASNLTSAGQAAGIGIIAAGGTLVEMALVQLTINLRYSLMALSLSQKLDSSFTTPHKLIASFGITDEIFAVSSGRRERLTPWYMYGMILVAFAGWVGGTVLGASAGELLPASVSSALSIMLYGMFIAIVVPPAKKEKGIVTAAAVAVVLSVVFKYLIPSVSSGFTVIICSIAASAAGAFLFPKEDDEE